jgi:hypothetical protein
VSGCHAGCRELVGEFAAGGICATADAFWGAMERLSRDEHADVRPNCADTVSTNARASYESEALRGGCTRWQDTHSKSYPTRSWRPSTEPLFLTTACSRKKSHRLDVNLIYNVKTRFERCHVVGALGTQGQGALGRATT